MCFPRFGSKCEGGHVWCVAVNTHIPKMASWHLEFSVAISNYNSYQFGPPSNFRRPPPIACRRLLMNSLRASTFGPLAGKLFLQAKIKSPKGLLPKVSLWFCICLPYVFPMSPLCIIYVFLDLCVFQNFAASVRGSMFGVALVSLWFPYVFPMSSLCLPYVFLMFSLNYGFSKILQQVWGGACLVCCCQHTHPQNGKLAPRIFRCDF